MKVSIKGTITKVFEDKVYIRVFGMGHEVFLTNRHCEELETGAEVELVIREIVGEKHDTLYGFNDEREAFCFSDMVKNLHSIGPRAVMALLDVLTVDEILDNALIVNNKAFSQAKGISTKGAIKIIEYFCSDKVRARYGATNE